MVKIESKIKNPIFHLKKFRNAVGNAFQNKSSVVIIVIFLFGVPVFPNFVGDVKGSLLNDSGNSSKYDLLYEEDGLDIQYIHNLTEALSNIIFTEYDEEKGEIAKGRAFGTKGEHRAAEILYRNMSELGLYTTMEKIKPRFFGDYLTWKTEINSYNLNLNYNDTITSVECAPRWVNLGTHNKPWKMNNVNFTYNVLKIRCEHPNPLTKVDDYVLIKETPWSKNWSFDGRGIVNTFIGKFKNLISLDELKEYILYPHCKGTLVYDYNNETYDMETWIKSLIPVFYINGSIGNTILQDVDNYTVDFYLDQCLNKSVESYNVIGQLNGTDPSKTVIIGCLYDSLWCQGTADSAIGMSLVLALAKYFIDYKITPVYTIKFIGFGGEEYGMRGSLSYEHEHKNEDIKYMIDFNQLGFTQIEPRLHLDIVSNNEELLNDVWKIAIKSDYENRTGNTTDLRKVYSLGGHHSDDSVFAQRRPFSCKTLCFLKSGGWIYHHRDGMDHTEGDVIKYFNWTDVKVTSEIILQSVLLLTT